MRPYLEERFGDPSSAHEYGRVALEGVEQRELDAERALAAVRLSLGQDATAADVDAAAALAAGASAATPTLSARHAP